MSRNYSSYSNDTAADWYAHDMGIYEAQEEAIGNLAEETTERNLEELVEKGCTELAGGVTFTLEELVDIICPEFFSEYISNNISKYFGDKYAKAFMQTMIEAAVKECEDWIKEYNYENTELPLHDYD